MLNREKRDAARLYVDGVPVQRIAAALGRSRRTISSWIHGDKEVGELLQRLGSEVSAETARSRAAALRAAYATATELLDDLDPRVRLGAVKVLLDNEVRLKMVAARGPRVPEAPDYLAQYRDPRTGRIDTGKIVEVARRLTDDSRERQRRLAEAHPDVPKSGH